MIHRSLNKHLQALSHILRTAGKRHFTTLPATSQAYNIIQTIRMKSWRELPGSQYCECVEHDVGAYSPFQDYGVIPWRCAIDANDYLAALPRLDSLARVRTSGLARPHGARRCR